MNAKIPVTVLFDQTCPVCRLLASLVEGDAPTHWTFTPWQNFRPGDNAPHSWREKRPRELRIVSGASFLEGEPAWEFLLREEPRLRKYQNIAAKAGLSLPTNAKWLRLLGHGLRKLCFSCSWAR